MTAAHDVALVVGYLWESLILAAMLLGVGVLIANAYLTVEQRIAHRWDHWRRFSQRYDAAHNPQRIDVSNVRVLPLPYPSDPPTTFTPWPGPVAPWPGDPA
jgi:hypothetical protein